MSIRACLGTLLVMSLPLLAQNSSGTSDASPTGEDRMAVPASVNTEGYSVALGSETRSNYVSGAISFTSAYSDNILGSANGKPVSDESYSISPSISLDKSTPRLQSMFTYSPGFTFYQHTSDRNQADHNFTTQIQYWLSPHVTISLQDAFHKTSSFFNQPNPTDNPVPGSIQPPTVAVVAPVADQLSNTGSAQLNYQFGINSMVGASGSFGNLHYLDSAQVPGLSDSSSSSASAFYNHRISKKHYVGATYQFQRILAYPAEGQSETLTHAFLGFYTVYLKPNLSISFSGGPQRLELTLAPFPVTHSWSPAATASVGWQSGHTSLAASYARTVTGGGGLIAAYHSNSAIASIRQQLTRNWNAGISGDYSIYKDVTPLFFAPRSGGHTVSGGASIQRQVGEHLSMEAGYTRIYQSYGNITIISTTPDTNRGWISISYHFARPLGR